MRALSTTRARGRGRRRRGIALMDVIVGGVILGVGISVIMSVTSRSLARQTDGEKRVVAAWLADELLNMVLVEGPIKYPKLHDSSAVFEAPFDEYAYTVEIEDIGNGLPLRVIASVRWPSWDPINEIQVETLIAVRLGDEEQPRALEEPLDRDARYFEDEEDL